MLSAREMPDGLWLASTWPRKDDDGDTWVIFSVQGLFHLGCSGFQNRAEVRSHLCDLELAEFEIDAFDGFAQGLGSGLLPLQRDNGLQIVVVRLA